jgi:hypothetical protein
METVSTVQKPEPAPASINLRDLLACLIAFSLAICVLSKLPAMASGVVLPTYVALGETLPLLTELSIRIAHALSYSSLVLTFCLGPALGGIHALLRPQPPRQKQFARATVGFMLLTTALLILGITLPLLLP